MFYKVDTVHIHFKLELKRYLEKKVAVKQFKLEKRYPYFDIKKSEEMTSNLIAQSPPAPKAAEEPRKSKMAEEPAKQSHAVKVAPKQQEEMDEETPEPKAEASSGVSHPLAGDIKVLSKAEFTQYLGQLKVAKAAAEKLGLELKDLVDFEKSSFSCKFLTIYLDQLEIQQAAIINAKTLDSEAVSKCKDLMLELTKRKGQLERNIGSGKLSPPEYLEVLKNEFDGLFAQAKFIKKFVKNTTVFKFMFAKAQIIDSEIKELEDFIKNS